MSWSEGYVMEVDYSSQVFREIGPAWLAFAARLCGVQAPRLDRPFTYLELGCGQGTSINLFAALFSQGRFLANDFNPRHVANARELRDAAGIDNLDILEDSFAELLQRDLPPFDFIVAHGILSWIGPDNQAHIAEIVRRHLKPGGLFYVSYNCAVGWAGMGSLRQLLKQHVKQDKGPLTERVGRALAFAREAAQAVRGTPLLAGLDAALDHLCAKDPVYLVHEFLGEHWQPLLQEEVAGLLDSAKLTYVGSARLAENFPALALPQPLHATIAALPAGGLREQLSDMAAGRQFRCDIYSRGGRPLTSLERQAALSPTRFRRGRPRSECPPVLGSSFGEVRIDPVVHAAILDRVGEGESTLQEILALPALGPYGPDQIEATVSLMTAADQLLFTPADAAVSIPGARALNRVLAQRAALGHAPGFMAAPAIAGPVGASPQELLFLGAVLEEEKDIQSLLLERLGRLQQPYGQRAVPGQPGLEGVRQLVTALEAELPRMRSLGLLPPSPEG
jgi:SAM-dependent methyltransferase